MIDLFMDSPLAARYCGQSYQSVQIEQDVSVLIK